MYHIVFCTKQRRRTINQALLEDLYRYIWAETKEMGSILMRIGGIENHVHMLIDLNSKVCIADFVACIKAKSSGWMRADSRFVNWEGWAREYFAATVANDEKDGVIEYIKSQREHHYGNSLDDEFRSLYGRAGLDYHEKDLTD
ncbi:MAG: IS200/IS605 family transposase [Lachnoclostridium sp.]|nr:IS200/IS605 family transposase [Lachnoclostridium sp.]